ncbi:GtrA family protein [Bifidobacterium aquikefiricola]|uniref:Bifunctional glycosyltransferase family 2/GtrA family protein n=1 Tax=Bifidobacterium aquikefiricola TaxID=3059038 RepID=A0AB39U581_9BIFI
MTGTDNQNGACRHIILIPTLQPQSGLLDYVAQLREDDAIAQVVIVDDGSGLRYRHIFNELERAGNPVLTHEHNQGKGAALKTGMAWIKEHYPQPFTVITVDSDGQHRIEDVIAMVRESAGSLNSLILGCRDFSTPGTPWKSVLGNKFSTLLFTCLYQVKLADTQTGMRSFGSDLVPTFLSLPGNGFEYETQMLVIAAQRHVPIVSMPIATIYNDGNQGTHFHAIRDSFIIMKALMGAFVSFSLSSLLCAIVDIALAGLFFSIPLGGLGVTTYMHTFVATCLARVMSIALNFAINRTLIFKDLSSLPSSLLRYVSLSLMLIVLSASGVYALHQLFNISQVTGKIICDCMLYFLSYYVQSRWVFNNDSRAQ